MNEMTTEELTSYNKFMEYQKNKKRMEELSKDFIQNLININVNDIENKKIEFKILLNKVREYEGKQPK